MAKDHYIQAAQIGLFSAQKVYPLRNSRVFVARKNVLQPYTRKAKALAFEQDLYGVDKTIDNEWDFVESRIPILFQAMEEEEFRGIISAKIWLEVLVPFIAMLFVRSPEFHEAFTQRMEDFLGEPLTDLVGNLKDHNNKIRLIEFQKILWPIMRAKWTLLLNETDESFIFNDRGFSPVIDFPLEENNQVNGYFFPLTKKIALLISYKDDNAFSLLELNTPQKWGFQMEGYSISNDGVSLFNGAVSYFCRNEIYAETENLALNYRPNINLELPEFIYTPVFLAPDGLELKYHYDMHLFQALKFLSESLQEPLEYPLSSISVALTDGLGDAEIRDLNIVYEGNQAFFFSFEN